MIDKNKNTKVLFLTLKTFDVMGGIEKVNRAILFALNNFVKISKLKAESISCYDTEKEEKYDLENIHRGYNGSKIKFTFAAIKSASKADIVVFSHINLSFVALLIKLFNPKIKLVLLAHGIEIWDKQSFHKRLFLRICDKFLPVSRFTESKLKEIHGIRKEKISVLNNCLDPFFQVPVVFEKPKSLMERYHLIQDQPVFLTVSRLSTQDKYKGYDRIIEIIAELKNDFPTVSYILAGKTDEDEAERINLLIKNAGIEKHIILPGFIPDNELSDHFLLADGFVMPSKKEGFGIVFIEASACGISVIAGNKDGSVDALLNGELGELVDPENSIEIKNAMRKAIINKSSIAEKKEISEKTINNFSFEQYQTNLLSELISIV